MNARDFFESDEPRLVAEAAADGRTEDLAALVARGADVNAKGREDMTPTYWAVANQSKKGVAFLLDHGGKPNVIFDRNGVLTSLPEQLEGTSATSLAAKLSDPWFLKTLLQHGGDLDIQNPLSGRTPIFEALASGRDENVKLLIKMGASLNSLDRNGSTPLVMAVGNQRFNLAYEMLVAGADPTIKTTWAGGVTALTILRQTAIPTTEQATWRLKVIDLLKAKGLDVERGR